jgi:hypothetical protein
LKRNISLALLILAITLLFANQAYAQRRVVINLPKYDLAPYHFGFILAVNQMHFTVKPVDGHSFIIWATCSADDVRVLSTDYLRLYEVTGVPTPGFTIGIVGNLRLGHHFDLRFIPSLAFGERYLDYNIMRYDLNGANELIPVRKAIASTFTEFPLHIKFRSERYNNIAAYLLAGGKYSLDLASNKKNEDRNNNLPVRLEQHDFAADVGVGFDFYTTYFKFGIELKMSYGLVDILVRDGNLYSESFDRINNKIFQLSFTFE